MVAERAGEGLIAGEFPPAAVAPPILVEPVRVL